MRFYEASRNDWNCIDYIQLDGVNTIIIRSFVLKGRKCENFSVWYPMPDTWTFRKEFYDSIKLINKDEFLHQMQKAIYHIDFVYKSQNKLLNYA